MVPRVRARRRESATTARKRKPRKQRWVGHWPGSEEWCRDVRRIGVDRPYRREDENDREYWQDIDPHDFIPGSSPAEHIVEYMELAWHKPSYDALMYVPHRWREASRVLKEWLVAAYATMIDEGAAQHREAALYSLWVDFFEVPERAAFVFPRLWKRVQHRDELLEASGPVPWEHKRSAYRAAAADPALHASLARGLGGSFYDVYGQVEPVEALALFRSIVVEDASVRRALESILFEPTRWRVVGVVVVDESDPRWRKWVPEGAAPSFLAELAPQTSPRWVKRSDLLHRERWVGRLLHSGFPFDEEIRHQREAVPHAEPDTVLFRIEGYVAAARAALGSVVDAWPPGLGPRADERQGT